MNEESFAELEGRVNTLSHLINHHDDGSFRFAELERQLELMREDIRAIRGQIPRVPKIPTAAEIKGIVHAEQKVALEAIGTVVGETKKALHAKIDNTLGGVQRSTEMARSLMAQQIETHLAVLQAAAYQFSNETVPGRRQKADKEVKAMFSRLDKAMDQLTLRVPLPRAATPGAVMAAMIEGTPATDNPDHAARQIREVARYELDQILKGLDVPEGDTLLTVLEYIQGLAPMPASGVSDSLRAAGLGLRVARDAGNDIEQPLVKTAQIVTQALSDFRAFETAMVPRWKDALSVASASGTSKALERMANAATTPKLRTALADLASHYGDVAHHLKLKYRDNHPRGVNL